MTERRRLIFEFVNGRNHNSLLRLVMEITNRTTIAEFTME
jgi:hypothetical protein